MVWVVSFYIVKIYIILGNNKEKHENFVKWVLGCKMMKIRVFWVAPLFAVTLVFNPIPFWVALPIPFF
jgi:hypothetical protein